MFHWKLRPFTENAPLWMQNIVVCRNKHLHEWWLKRHSNCLNNDFTTKLIKLSVVCSRWGCLESREVKMVENCCIHLGVIFLIFSKGSHLFLSRSVQLSRKGNKTVLIRILNWNWKVLSHCLFYLTALQSRFLS